MDSKGERAQYRADKTVVAKWKINSEALYVMIRIYACCVCVRARARACVCVTCVQPITIYRRIHEQTDMQNVRKLTKQRLKTETWIKRKDVQETEKKMRIKKRKETKL